MVNRSVAKVCNVIGCSDPPKAKAKCNKHYLQLQRLGSVAHARAYTRDGRSRHALYSTWRAMKQRCSDKNKPEYENYGGRGINVCERWANHKFGFWNFVHDMGPKPSQSHTLDRKDNDKPYEPNNCHWATRHEQQKNRRNHADVVGVYENKSKNTWVAFITVNQHRYSKSFKAQKSAIKHRTSMERQLL